MRWRALVLAAGFGTRLRPLTETLPKPLLPVLGRPLVAWTLDRLVAAGCEAAALNLHHLGEAIPPALGTSWRGMPLRYSEEPEILGTLGALAPLADFFAGCDALAIVNGDSLCAWPMRRLLRRHRRTGAAATLLLARAIDPVGYGGGVGVDGEGRVVSFRPGRGEEDRVARRAVFAGAHVLDPALVERAPRAFADTVKDLYEPLLAEGRSIATLSTGRAWHDLGTPARYLEGVLAWSDRGWRRRRLPDSVVCAPGSRVRRAVIERGGRLDEGARVRNSLLLPEAQVGARSRLNRCLVGPGTRLPAETLLENRMVTRLRAETGAPAGSSRVGDLLLSPLVPEGGER